MSQTKMTLTIDGEIATMSKWDCSCWCHYPNENHKHKNGKWKCVDKYVNVRDLVEGRYWDCCTHCVRRERIEMERDCENCKHRVMKVEVGKGTPPEHFWGCECWECEFEPTTENCESCRYYGSHHEACNYCYKCSLWTEQEPTTKNDLGMFVPVILTDEKGNKRNAFLYKPQRLIVTSYITEELAKALGYKIEVEDGNDV